MVILLDTSAIYALADRSDPHHEQAKRLFHHALESGETLLVHNYILLESAALLSKRLGLTVAVQFLQDAEAFQVRWVDHILHRAAVRQWMGRRGGKISLVDQVSFLIMREHAIPSALAFDEDFPNAGFPIYAPASP
jgi:predicted nucleic acid-binding protein